MNYFLNEEQKMILELARKIAQEKVAKVAAKLDETEEFPWEIIKTLASVDLMGLYISQEYAGFGGGIFELCLAVEELSRACGGVAVSYSANALGSYPIILFGKDEQKKKYLTPIAKGEKLAAFALTEAEAGSDAGSIKTKAAPSGDYYILNGTKQWITNGGEADIYTVFAITDKSRGSRGASAFILEKGWDGFSFGKKEKKLGIRCSATRELIFEDCRVPKENLLSKEGMGFIIAMKTLDNTRPAVAAQALGIAQGALDEALKFAKTRIQFGHPITYFQAVQHMLADMATQIEAARALTYSTAKMIDQGEKDFSKESAMSKLFASDTAMKVTTDAIQIMGGHGYMREYPLEKKFRDAKITQIYEGTNQIQRNVIALELIKQSQKKF
ncbi:MAG: acyl-CoA dehydrogenase family protein [Armatimonadetes bacterium]|nr:acyl-CoA dehydrogenase family protein [Armatimonadota bacterium]